MLKKKYVFGLLLFGISMSALADLHLTPSQCNEYPFTKPTSQLTRRAVQRELAELEGVGYQPYRIDIYYPDDIDRAEAKLQAVYRRDCSATPAPSASD